MAITKHRMNRIYCCLKKVKQLYLKRKGKGKWDKGEEHDDQIFLDMEKKIYLEMFPHNQGVFGENEDGSGDKDDDVEDMSEHIEDVSA